MQALGERGSVFAGVRDGSDGGMKATAIIDPEAGDANKLFTMSASNPGASAQHDVWGRIPNASTPHRVLRSKPGCKAFRILI
jgi:hypothetical protein